MLKFFDSYATKAIFTVLRRKKVLLWQFWWKKLCFQPRSRRPSMSSRQSILFYTKYKAALSLFLLAKLILFSLERIMCSSSAEDVGDQEPRVRLGGIIRRKESMATPCQTPRVIVPPKLKKKKLNEEDRQ